LNIPISLIGAHEAAVLSLNAWFQQLAPLASGVILLSFPYEMDVDTFSAVGSGLMVRRLNLSVLAVFLLAASGCTRPVATTQSRAPEAYVSDSGSVGFDIKPLQGENGSVRFRATYQSERRLAKFTIEFGPTRSTEGMETGHGRFVAEPGSDASALLSDLKKALEAKAIPTKVERVKTLPFTFVNIGNQLSQGPGGGFNVNPPGNWTAIKIFIGEGEQEGDVFININTVIGKGQFSIKDPDYGDQVLQHLATVL
jgi:hypothetical protein